MIDWVEEIRSVVDGYGECQCCVCLQRKRLLAALEIAVKALEVYEDEISWDPDDACAFTGYPDHLSSNGPDIARAALDAMRKV
jgi:hypothetical protein